jgi:hypothetical protein
MENPVSFEVSKDSYCNDVKLKEMISKVLDEWFGKFMERSWMVVPKEDVIKWNKKIFEEIVRKRNSVPSDKVPCFYFLGSEDYSGLRKECLKEIYNRLGIPVKLKE